RTSRAPGMDWQKELDELRRRGELASQLGGPERVKRQHDGGRLTILERVAKLADPGSFHEIGKIAVSARYDANNDLVAFTPSNFVFGRAEVDGRPVVIGGDDFTVRGGSADATIKGKHNQCERLGQKLTKNELGGWEIQLKAGAVDDAVDSEEEAFACARRFLSYFPSSIDDLPPRGPRGDDPQRRDPWLFEAIPHDPRKPYKM